MSLANRLMVAMCPGQAIVSANIPAEVRIQTGSMSVETEVEQGLILSEALIQSEIERKSGVRNQPRLMPHRHW